MGADPKSSVVNRYLQAWDAHNLFVQGASVFPQQHGYNPTGTVGALAYWSAQRDHDELSQKSGTAGSRLEHDPEKWKPVFGKDHAQTKNLWGNNGSKKLAPSSALRLPLLSWPSPQRRPSPPTPPTARWCSKPAPPATATSRTRSARACAACTAASPASLDDFRYSNAMMRANLTWDDANLKAYIKDPQAKVKGNRMPFGGLIERRRTSTTSSPI